MVRALALLLALGLAPRAAAQSATPMDPAGRPAAGTLAPASGSAAEVRFQVRPEVESPVAGCPGYVDPSAPDAVVEWGGGDLRVWARAPFDATLLVGRPDGTWACDDDTEGFQPVVEVAGAPAGRYAVWLGSFALAPDGQEAPSATLYAGAPPPPPVLDARAPASAGTVRAQGGFEAARGAIEVSVRAGGPDDAARIDLDATPDPPPVCTGYVDAGRPTAAVDYDADGGTGALGVSASADQDLVLVVQTPDGRVLCNDDASGSDPAVGVEDPASGVYAVWVGTFLGGTDPVGATLVVSESLPGDDYVDDEYAYDDPAEAQPYSEGTYTPLDLDTVPQTRIQADADGPGAARVTVRPDVFNPVQGLSCLGAVEAAATAAVELDGPGPFAVTASGDDDLTLTLRTPSGAWLCSDDADGLDPGVQVDSAEPGLYLVWVGAFVGPDEEVSATLAATPGELVVSRAPLGAGPARQSGGDYAGTEIQAGSAAVAVDWSGADDEAAVEAGGGLLNPVEGPSCAGFVSERPTAEVRVSADGQLELSAHADEDLTLTVLAPDGTWTCGDDAEGTDPRVELDGAAGVYSVWVGTYYRRAATPATLRLRARRPVLPLAPPPPPSIRG